MVVNYPLIPAFQFINFILNPYINMDLAPFNSADTWYSNKKSRKKNSGTQQFKLIVLVYYFFFDFSFNSSLSLSDGFQTFTSESLSIPEPGNI